MPNCDLAITNALPIGIAMLDSSLKILSWNATLERWSGINSKDAIGNSLGKLFPTASIAAIDYRLKSVFNDGQSVIFSPSMHRRLLPLHTASGEPLLHKAHFSPSPHGGNQALLVLEDVTANYRQLDKLRAERKRLKESEISLKTERQKLVSKNAAIAEARRKAEEANQAKSCFLASMSHEIRTPITAISGFAEILHERVKDPITRDAAETIIRNSEHLTKLVNDILDLSKIEAGKLILTNEPCSPSDIAKQAVTLLSARADSKGLGLSLEIKPNTPSLILSDPLRLRQIVFNLLGNAVKFTEKGSVKVKLHVNEDSQQLEFIIIDTGIGIREANLEAIFDPFSQEDASMQRRFGGTGLGLAISRNLIVGLGGNLGVHSEVGVGSEFHISLPIVLAEEQITETIAPQESCDLSTPIDPEKPLDGQRILVAEDGLDNQKLIRFLLERAGAEIRMVENGKLALEALENRGADWQADLLLLDMQMPVMDGYTTASTLRSVGNDIPIIALTAHAMEGDRNQAIQAGCDDYATKPIDVKRLITLIQHSIDHSKTCHTVS